MVRISRRTTLLTTAVLLSMSMASRSPARTIKNDRDTVCTPALQRPGQASSGPYTTHRTHDAGNMWLTVTNWGVLGNPWYGLIDQATGWPAFGAAFPRGAASEHLNFGSLWVGALVEKATGCDTLVSTGYELTEFYPDSYSNEGDFTARSNDPNSPHYDSEAISGQDFLCTFTDTLTNPDYVPLDQITMMPHKPLGIGVRQSSYVWPRLYAQDFVTIQYQISNIGGRDLHEAYVGVLVAPQVGISYSDDMVGFLRTASSMATYNLEDTIMTAWWADADGDLSRKRGWYESSVRSVMGLRFLGVDRSACDSISPPLEYSFNWWAPHDHPTYDWGPQRHPGDRSITGAWGQPRGDAQRYRYMANREIDYDQWLSHEDYPDWISPPDPRFWRFTPYNLADGHDVRLLLSIGPFELRPGDSISLAIGIAGGEFLHSDPDNRHNLDRYPMEYYKNLDFTDLEQNMQWAAYVYDNPGIDTDGDGCAGKVFTWNCRDICIPISRWQCRWIEICDSVYYAGDGIPDLKGPPPPPSPQISVATEPGKIYIKWDGREPELFVDPFLQRCDFEGYNVYLGLGHNPNTLDLMASWDLVNFDRYGYDAKAWPSRWVSRDPPLAIDQLCRMYGDDFIPQQYPDHLSYFEDDNGNRFFFKPHGGNRGNEYREHGVILPNSIQYVRTDSLWNENKQLWDFFGHYECMIENLLPSQPYYVAVTAFDGGRIGSGLESLESSLQSNMQLVYPSYSPDYVAANRMKVSVYPNPYRIDGRYRERRFEDPNREGFKERTRRIHFVNLPPKATIKIFSLDGDLIREIHHPESRFSDTPSHTAWDLISRNTQAVTSGIYLYSVESDWGTQVGKIVIIK